MAEGAAEPVVEARNSPAMPEAEGLPLNEPPSPDGRRNLRVVPDRTLSPTRRRRRTRILLLTGASLVVLVAFGLVYLHVVLAQRQFALDRLTNKVQTDRSTYERLRLQVAQLGSPANIISTAEGRLGMRQPTSVTYLTPTITIKGSAPATSSAGTAPGTAQAPAGDADWPKIKALLAGSP
jgi:cell division protein FtsL